ncbi:MAG: hypothetical protein ABI904_15485 [Chloroflexota bacterium]
MKKVLLTLLGIIVVIGILAGAGFAGYRMGYMRGALVSADGTTKLPGWDKAFGPQGMPMHNFGNGFERGFNNVPGHQGFGMMQQGMHGRGSGFFSPLFFLIRIAFWGLVIWLAYKFIKGSGWHLSLTRQTAESPKAEPAPNVQTSEIDK